MVEEACSPVTVSPLIISVLWEMRGLYSYLILIIFSFLLLFMLVNGFVGNPSNETYYKPLGADGAQICSLSAGLERGFATFASNIAKQSVPRVCVMHAPKRQLRSGAYRSCDSRSTPRG